MEYLNFEALQGPIMTGLGAFSIFPAKPKIIQDLSNNEWFQWLMVFVLIMQGKGQMNAQLAAVTVVVLYAITKILDMMYDKKEGFY